MCGTTNNVYGTMDNFNGTVNNVGGTMYIQYHIILRNLKQCWWNHEYHKHYLSTMNHLVSNAYMVTRWWCAMHMEP